MLESENDKPNTTETKVAADSDTSPVTTESNKRRAFLGAIIGAGIFIVLLITIIALLATADTKYIAKKPQPKRRPIVNNPFVLDDLHTESNKLLKLSIVNQRTLIEKNLTATTTDSDSQLHAYTPVSIKNTTDNYEPPRLTIEFIQVDEHMLNVRYTDADRDYWSPPKPERDKDPYERVLKQIRSPLHVSLINYTMGGTFEWKFNGKVLDIMPLISTEGCRLQYFSKYIEFEARLQTDQLFGMGERTTTFALKNGNYSLWNRAHNYEYGHDPETGTYGSHPFFLNKLKHKTDFIGVYMHNSNAMLFGFRNTINDTYINYKMIGGIIDMYVFHEAEPMYIIRRYHELIGRPYLPPMWAMGLQQARRGYTVEKMKEVWKNYQDNGLPIDAFWADIDINDNHKTFTVDQTKFAGVKEFVANLHKANMSFVTIANPYLKKETGYKYYEEGVKQSCLIMDASDIDKPYEGHTLAGTSVWLDFFTDEARLIWAGGLHDMKELTGLDGVWISGDEIANMYDAVTPTMADPEGAKRPNPFHNTSEFDYIQYRPTLDPLDRSTLPMSAYQAGDVQFHKQYYTHNLYGLEITKATFESLYGIFEDKRFLVASRSTWPGSGHYGSHWLGDNYATWDSMLASIPGILNFNMFGIPHVGAPIGGVYGKTDPELLTRWYELASYSPLMLSYSGATGNGKEAYVNKDMIPYVKEALMERYSLIRFMYTEMFEAFAWGGSVVHPLFFDFPDDPVAYDRNVVDRTFMWADTLYIVPTLIKGQTTIKAYLPNWRWYNLLDFELVKDYKEGGTGDYMLFPQELGHVTVLIKGGCIIPYQLGVRSFALNNTEDLKKTPALIIVAPDHTGRATGTLVVDANGIRPIPDPASQSYRHYAFSYMNQIFRINKLAGYDFHELQDIDYFMEVIILDVFERHNVEFVCMMDTEFRKKDLEFWHSAETKALIIHDTRNKLVPLYDLESITWGTSDQHDFCKYQVHVESRTYPTEQSMQAVLATTDEESRKLRFDLKAMVLTDKIISMQISRNGFDPWIVPEVVEDEVRSKSKATISIQNSGFRISPDYEPFFFEISDPVDTQDFFFTTRNLPFVYVDNFIHMKFMVNSRHVFGMGERVHKFELADGIYSMFNADQMSEESRMPPGNNMYGTHPFYLVQLQNPKEFAGVFVLNSCPMDFRVKHVGVQMQIDHILIGGIIDTFFFQKNTAEEVIRAYQYIIGKPTPLPYWAFGYHQSRWGYRDIDHLKIVISGFEGKAIPLDAIWMDKDYMQNYRVFTIDTKNWAGIKDLVKTLHKSNRHFVSIIDPGIAVDEEYRPYREGKERKVFITSDATKEPLVGVTWPGYSVWIDFVSPLALDFWEQELLTFYESIPFDGLWLDMNEPSNFCDGECSDEKHYIYYHFPLDYYDDLYYNPTHRGLERSTISVEAKHYGGMRYDTEFYYHNLYGLMQTKSTAAFFNNYLHTRPFIVSSSTFPGIGRYAAHWLGDNYSSWTMMEYSISGMFNFQLFGIPFVGADICGYEGNATTNLCSRWMQLGAFYPFMRNHNSPNGHPQEPYIDDKLADISRKAILTRYSLVRYLYSDYMHVSVEGGIVIRPLLFVFPADKMMYSIMDETFMFGYAIRVTPVMSNNTATLLTYFPNHDWFELDTFKQVVEYNSSATTGKNLTLICSLDSGRMNLHIMGGSIFPYQDEALNGAKTVIDMLSKSIKLVVAPDHNAKATGYLFYDDDTILMTNEKMYHDYKVALENATVKFVQESGDKTYTYPHNDDIISEVVILGKHYPEAKCAKVVEHAKTVRLKVTRKADTLVLTPESDYMMNVQNIDSISWYDTTEC